MKERRFDITFDGSVINGAKLLDVKQNVQRLFKLDESEVNTLFSGQHITIKKDLDRQTASQYQKALTQAGAKIQLVLHKAPGEEPLQAPYPEQTLSNEASTALVLLPAGSNLLNANERQIETAVVVDTSRFVIETIDETDFDHEKTGTPNQEYIGSYPSNSHIQLDSTLTVAETGIDAGINSETLQKSIAPLDINIDHLSLTNIFVQSPNTQDETVETITITDFSLAEIGSDLLQQHEKAAAVHADIDTSQLTLSQESLGQEE